MGTILGGLYFEEFDNLPALDGGMFVFAIFMTVLGVFVLAFNSGNVSEKTDAKINRTITLSLDANNAIHLPGLPPVPTVIGTSPSLPITRSVNDDVPELPPPGLELIIIQSTEVEPELEPILTKPYIYDKTILTGMAGTIARIHGLHRSMATMHFTKDGKPFYLDKDGNTFGIISMEKLSITNLGRIAHLNGLKRGHVKSSKSLPNYSSSSNQGIIYNHLH